MSLFEVLPYLSRASIVSLLAVCAVGLVAALTVLGLRFARRGPSRFWLAPAFLTLAWLPLVAGAGLAALGVVRVAEAVTLVGTGSVAAVQAGLLEAQLPLLLGLVGTAGVAGLALLLLAFGLSTRVDPSDPEGPRVGPPAVAAAASAIALGLGLAVPAAGHWLSTSPTSAATFARAVAPLAVAFALLIPIGALLLALGAPRGSAPPVWRVVALGAPGALVVCALAAAAVGVVWLQRAPLSDGPAPAAATPAEDRLLSGPLATAPADVAPTPAPPAPHPSAADAPSKPLRVGGTIREPKKLRNVPPVYPAGALQSRVQGTVILECLIGTDGRIARVKVLKGVPLLDEAATEAVRQWQYEPTLVNGVPVSVILTVTVSFKLS